MSNIEKNLETIRKGVYGKDVRQAIHDAIEECYTDGHAGAVDLVARERINTLIGGTGDLVEVPLFEELELFAYDQTFTIDPDEYLISDFDYIAVYYKVVASGAPEVKWYTANDFLTLPVVISGVFLENAGHKLSAREIHIRCTDTDDQTFEVYLANNWKLNGSDAADGGTYTEVEATDEEKAGVISMISGIKFAPSAEVADIRVGEDGTTYASAGEAVRTQISDVKSQIEQGGGLNTAVKDALLAMFRKCVLFDGGDEAYTDLYNALYPPVGLESISAVFTQGSAVIYDTDNIDILKSYLVVTANYDDSSSEEIYNYTLSGTLQAGTSTITVSYGGESDTFTVTVTHDSRVMLYNWDFTQSLVDTIQGTEAVLGKASGALPTQDAFGVHVTTTSGYINLGQIYQTGITVEIDFGEMDRKGSQNGRLLMVGSQSSGGLGTGLIYRSTGVWNWYVNGAWATSSGVTDANIFSEKTLKAIFDASGYMTVYCDDTYIGKSSKAFATSAGTYMQIGAYSGTGGYTNFYNMTVKAVRIYSEGE